MKALILWLHRRRLANILILISYYLLVVLPHEQVGLFTVQIFGHLSRDTYNFIVILVGILGLVLSIVPLIKKIKHGKDSGLKVFYLGATVGLIALVINTLFVINIEIVHFIQYAVMAILLFPITLHYWDTLYWATLLGALDEAYQYFYLAPQRTDYYDFNDVITNLLGAALGLVFLRIFDLGKLGSKQQMWWRSLTFWTSVGLVILFFILISTRLLYVYPPQEGVTSIFTLVKVVPTSFWSVVHPNVTYHVILPLEGILWLGLLLLFYSKLNYTNHLRGL